MVRAQIVGGGRMGEALLGGLIASKWAEPAQLRVVEESPERRSELQTRWPECDISGFVGAAEGTVIAVKPGDVAPVVAEVVAAGGGRVLSIAAGVSLGTLESAAGREVPVIRAMPNTPALVGQGASAIAAGSSASEVDMKWAEGLLGAVGVVVRVAERQLDAVTGLSGSGPAYLFVVAEALIDAGVSAGLSRDIAVTLATQTMVGSAALLAGGESPSDLRAAVTSPGGTTAAGVRELERHAVRAAFVDAVHAAAARSAELA